LSARGLSPHDATPILLGFPVFLALVHHALMIDCACGATTWNDVGAPDMRSALRRVPDCLYCGFAATTWNDVGAPLAR